MNISYPNYQIIFRIIFLNVRIEEWMNWDDGKSLWIYQTCQSLLQRSDNQQNDIHICSIDRVNKSWWSLTIGKVMRFDGTFIFARQAIIEKTNLAKNKRILWWIVFMTFSSLSWYGFISNRYVCKTKGKHTRPISTNICYR